VAIGAIGPGDVVLWALVAIAAIWDLTQRRIPNALIVVGLLLGIALQVQAQGPMGIVWALVGMGVALVALIGPFILRMMGGGDVKLAMVCGAFTGWVGAIHIILVGTVIHGLVTVIVLVRAKLRDLRQEDPVPLRGVPHAVGFAVGAVLYGLGILHLW